MSKIGPNKRKNWTVWNADCIEVVNALPENSLHLAFFSPYASLYTYSNSDRDMGNSASDKQFYEHFDFSLKVFFDQPCRAGLCVDVMNIPAMKKSVTGSSDFKDFRGDIIRAFTRHGFIFHSEHCA